MRKFITALSAAALAAISLVSCDKQEAKLPNMDKAPVSLSLTGVTYPVITRADGDAVPDTENERKVNRYDIFVFKTDGSLDTYYGSESAPTQTGENGAFTTGEFYVSTGTLDFWVIANGPTTLKSSVTTLTQLNAAVSTFATENAAAGNSFVMVGKRQYQVQPGIATTQHLGVDANETAANKPAIQLERVVNKISIKKITKAFESDAIQSQEVKLLGLWIVMANKQAKYTVGYDSGSDEVPAAADASYLNYDSTHLEDNALITWVPVAADQPVINSGAGTAMDHSFYFYPNPAAVSPNAQTQDFVTKLVMRVSVGGQEYFYPIGIQQNTTAAAARNRYYEVTNITLRRPGNKPTDHDINDYIDNAVVDVTMTVKDWVSADITGQYNYDLLN